MKLEITFQGKTRNRDAFIRSIQRLAKSQEYQLGAWKDGMRVVLCPLGYLDMGWTRESGYGSAIFCQNLPGAGSC